MAELKKKKIIKSGRLDGSGSRIKKSLIRIQKNSKRVIHRTLAEIQRRRRVKQTRKVTVLDLKRSRHNPIIEPTPERYWDSKATFNPTAFYKDGKVHIIYRAIGESDNSVLGYAESDDGSTISHRFPMPIYFHFMRQNKDRFLSPISYSSGGGWGGGCEDPRVTLLGDKLYMIYTAFDGWGSVRVALTSIGLDDFIARRFDWKKPVLISPPGEIHKNWVLFPEKIGDRYAILHSFAPKILVEYFDSLDELDGKKFIKSNNTRPVDPSRTWDSWFRGVGPSPIKTKYGWLVIYQAMDYRNSDKYKLGAMILDIKDPTKILYRSNQPILEPDEWYENEGFKSGVVYSCGAIVKQGQLFVYYGGADKVSCVATADLEKFLKELIHSSTSKLKSEKIEN